jgi:hypothetical protein
MANTTIPVELSSTPGIVDNSNATAITIDSSENVGIGVTPSAWRTAYSDKALDLGAHSALYDQFGGSTFLANNFYRSNDNSFKYKTTAGATAISLDAGSLSFSNAPSGTAGTTATFTTRMTLDSSGNVGIGTTSPSSKLFVSDSGGGNIGIFTNTTDADLAIKCLSGVTLLTPSTGILALGTSNVERLRIDSGGNLLWANTGGVSSSQPGITFNNTTVPYIQVSGGSDTVFRYRMEFINGNGTVGTITTNGSATAYNTSSDYRLKENVDYDFNALDRVAQLKPARFNFISDETNTLVDGFLAHEVQDIVPEAIHGVKDEVDEDGNAVYQGIDQSKLVPLLTKAIQEQQALIESLTARITTLEG